MLVPLQRSRSLSGVTCLTAATLMLLSNLSGLEGRPQSGPLVVSSTLPTTTTTDAVVADPKPAGSDPEGVAAPPPPPTTTEEPDDGLQPIMTEFHVRSDIQFRYARTVVETYVKNPSNRGREVAFNVVLPDAAFVSNFSMLLKEREYVARVEKKATAQRQFDAAVSGGQGAGLVDQDARDAHQINVRVHVSPRDKVRFRLTYEQLLRRRLGRYEHALHVNPGRAVDALVVDVHIDESLPVVDVSVPELKTDPNAITSHVQNPLAQIVRDPEDDAKVHVQFRPTVEQQTANGLNGQFLVQYDVDRKGQQGEIQVLDGYFVHFFAPDALTTLPKHVVFVLDVSGSMHGEKLRQTKDAMVTVIDDLTEQDRFNIITFSDDVYHWVPKAEKDLEGPHALTYRGSQELRNEALKHVLALRTIGGTNINDGMLAALELIKKAQQSEEIPSNTQPIVIFLTDGQPTTGVINHQQIKANVKSANLELEVPIYGLAFGAGADFNLIKTLSVENHAFARRIYEGSDAAIQLEDFYLEIASPLLANLKFDYVGELVVNGSVTKTSFNSFNKGNEIVIAGKLNMPASNESDSDGDIENEIPDFDLLIAGEGKQGSYSQVRRVCLPPWRPLPVPLPMPKLPLPLYPAAEDTVGTEEAEAVVQDSEDTPRRLPHLHPHFPILPERCVPVRPRPPPEPRSDAQNFIERLWAFMTINQLLDDKPTATEERKEELLSEDDVNDDVDDDEEAEEEEDEPAVLPTGAADNETAEAKLSLPFPSPPVIVPKPKTRKEKALDLALKYNFVTPITSLVVVKPKETKEPLPAVPEEEAVAEEDHVVVDPVPVQLSSSTSNRRFFAAGGGALRASAPGPRRKTAGRFPLARLPAFGGSGGFGGHANSRVSPQLVPAASAPTFPTTTRSQGTTTTAMSKPSRPPPPPSQPQGPPALLYDADMDMDELDFADDFESESAPAPRTSCDGSISMHSTTYLRGQNVTLELEDAADLSVYKFDNKLTSLEVRGNCCWRVYVDKDFQGQSVLFSEGKKSSASDMGALFREASSVKRIINC